MTKQLYLDDLARFVWQPRVLARFLVAFSPLFAVSVASADLLVGGIIPNSDPTAYDVLRFDDTTGQLLGTFADASNGLHYGSGITMGPNRDVFIADRDPHRILR
jgi:hypothetical protein